MHTSLKAGRLFGIPLHLHWTLLLVVAWVFYDGYAPGYGFRWDRISWVGGVILLLFFFVLVHELGHALTARAFGRPTEKILLFPLGGGAYIREQPAKVWQEILVYLGGPLANIVLALLVLPILLEPDRWLLLRYYFQPNSNVVLSSLWWEDMLCLTVAVNTVLALINLVPAYPLDGGRILQAVLRKPLGNRSATVVVTILGILAGLAFIWVAWRLWDPIMGVGGVFVAALSVAEINSGWQRRRLKKYSVADLVRPIAQERLYLQDNLTYAQRQLDYSGWPVLPVYNEWNEMTGLLAAEVLESQTTASAGASVRDAYDPVFTCSLLNDNLLDATVQIIEADSYGALVYDRQRPAGILLMDDVLQLLERRF